MVASPVVVNRLAAAGIPEAALELKAAQHAAIPGEMARKSAGIFFYKPTYSRAVCSPTKLGEFLGCGIPCLSNSGLGDMAGILEGERVGVALDAFDEATLVAALGQLMSLAVAPETTARCVAAARKHFSLEEGVARYAAIYRSLAAVGS